MAAISRPGAGTAPKVPGPSPDRPHGLAIGQAGCIAQIYFGFGRHKVLLPLRWIAIPRSGEGPFNVRSGAGTGLGRRKDVRLGAYSLNALEDDFSTCIRYPVEPS